MHQALYLLAITIGPSTFPAARFADLGTLVNIIAPLLTIGGAILFGIMMVMVGYRILNAGSNKDEISKAGSTATWAITGLLIIISAYLVIKLVELILGIDLPL